MPDHPPIPLVPSTVELDSAELREIAGWQFVDSYVQRLLRDDIPQRAQTNGCQVWVYRDPGNRIVGFGTLELCGDWSELTEGRPHLYIPLLAVNPATSGLGYGTSIVRHLIAEAALIVRHYGCDDLLFLDVYATNERAIRLYGKCGFGIFPGEPLRDEDEGGAEYIVMAQRVSVVR